MKISSDLLILIASIFAVVLSLILVLNGSVIYIPFYGDINMPLCWIKSLTGVNCPTCGLTRSFISIGHIHFQEAIFFNKAGILAYIFVIFQIPYRIYKIRSIHNDSKTTTKKFMTIFTYVLAFSLLLNWVIGLNFV